MNQAYHEAEYYCTHIARAPRFDGKFFVAVKTTMFDLDTDSMDIAHDLRQDKKLKALLA